MAKVNAHLARRFLEQAIQALQGDEQALEEALQGPLGRSVQLHRDVAGPLDDPVNTSESSLTLLEWWLESIGAVEPEPETTESWVEQPTSNVELRIPDEAPAAQG